MHHVKGMEDSKISKYIEGKGWRYDTEHSMKRRMEIHDYQSRSIYMITMSVTDRQPCLGSLTWSAPDGTDATVVPSAIGREVERCWYDIPQFYPEIRILGFQLMPDHIHGVLFVTNEMKTHLGKVIKGFKIGCSRALWHIEEQQAQPCPSSTASSTPSSSANYNSPHNNPPHNNPPHNTPPRRPLFEQGYQDTVLTGKGQLDNMMNYIRENPMRLAVKKMNPDLFRVITQLTIDGTTYAAIGNRWLLNRPVRLQVRCHNNTTEQNLRFIEKQKAYFLDRTSEGAVIVSPCISAGEKEIARAILDAKRPLITIIEKGFPPMYKPPGKYFTACAEGLLLMLAPWPYHMERRTITRTQCLALNDMARSLSTDPWSDDLIS